MTPNARPKKRGNGQPLQRPPKMATLKAQMALLPQAIRDLVLCSCLQLDTNRLSTQHPRLAAFLSSSLRIMVLATCTQATSLIRLMASLTRVFIANVSSI